MILIGDFNLPPINYWGNAYPFQGDFEPITQAFVDTFVSFGLSQRVTKFMFLRSGNILYLVFTSAIDRIGNVNIHCPFPHCGHCLNVFYYIFDSSYE